MAYSVAKYKAWRSLKVDRRIALALANDAAPRSGVGIAAVADIPTPGSATAPTCAAKINELLAAMRTAGDLAP